MNAPTRLVLMLGLLCVGSALNGCSAADEDTTPIPTPPAKDPNAPCTVDQDCPDPSLFFCNTVASRCEPACRTREDCSALRRGPYSLNECDRNPLGCQCDTGKCVASLCWRDADCDKKVCRDGHCVEKESMAAAASCRVIPDFVIGTQGTRVRFDVAVSDAEGEPVVPAGGISWAAASEAVVREGLGTSTSVIFTLSAPAEAMDAVEVRVGNASCRARVTVLPVEVEAGQVRVVVTDELTGRPLPGTWVVVADEAGSATGSGVADAGGVAQVPASGVVSVTAFHADYGYLTLAHYDTASGSRDLSLPLRRNPLAAYGGTKGTFTNLPVSSNLHMGFAGMSLPGLGLDLTNEQILGPTKTVPLNMGGFSRDLSLPQGAFLALPSDSTPGSYAAPGVAGVCDASLAGDLNPEDALRAGACGTRTAWALAGDVPPTELPPSLFGPTVDIGQVLAQSIPLLRRFHSSVVRDVQFRLVPTPGAETGAPDFQDTAHYTALDHDFQQLPLGFQFAVRVPSLPRYRGAFLDGAFVLGGVDVPGQGVVPLGLGFAVNVAPADPNTDLQAGLPAPGLVSVRMAPAHHGLEGYPYRLLVFANANTSLNDASAGAASSVLVEPLPSLLFDPKGATPLSVAGSFLPVPEGARYNFDSAPNGGLAGRQFRFVSDPGLSGVSVLRVVLTNRVGRRWTVLLDPAHATTGFRLPVPPAPFEDRTYSGDVTGSRSQLLVQAISARAEDGGRLGPVALVESNDLHLGRLSDFIRAASLLDYRRPEVSWLVPEGDGLSVPRESTVRVRTTSFRIGSGPTDDGYVQLSFNGGAGCEGQTVRGDVDASQGRGEVDLRLPPGCSGLSLLVTATLVDPTGAPLRPPVFSSRRLNIP
ncbi:carboxypeptidase regulatory-like domain-containing protein [Hyalangium rubrum]|uniref:Carboxypeptidase regulatory-like domain-containing protein n=1 Tax=Hyalangium rubrum TaxID=3103134 RepID=A0ABU5H497_9BACT|nr:carboxypeptidase regulatory-like domain-containing protein [Hyalangium sp. s54d21]MDY7227919.1 carboxypeptidase regulatory-like domain-containing protein [Hyalangium sp. s54d21]